MQDAPTLEIALPQEPPKPRVWPMFLTFVGVFIGMQIVGAVLLIGGMLVQFISTHPGAREAPSPAEFKSLMHGIIRAPWFLAGSTLLNAIAFGTTAWVACVTAKQSARERLRLVPAPGLQLLLAPVLFLSLSLALEHLTTWLDLMRFSLTLPVLTLAIEGLSRMSLPLALFAVAILPGIGEELFFRGFIQTRLTARWGSRTGIVVTALFFGVMHADPVHSLVTFFMGLSLGWLYERTRSLWPCIAAHVVNNACSTLQVRYQFKIDLPPAPLIALTLIIALGAALMLHQQRTVVDEVSPDPS